MKNEKITWSQAFGREIRRTFSFNGILPTLEKRVIERIEEAFARFLEDNPKTPARDFSNSEEYTNFIEELVHDVQREDEKLQVRRVAYAIRHALLDEEAVATSLAPYRLAAPKDVDHETRVPEAQEYKHNSQTVEKDIRDYMSSNATHFTIFSDSKEGEGRRQGYAKRLPKPSAPLAEKVVQGEGLRAQNFERIEGESVGKNGGASLFYGRAEGQGQTPVAYMPKSLFAPRKVT